MSHLTAPMPHAGQRAPQKPYLFDFPRPAHPLTPPDTDYETLQQPQAQNAVGLETDPLPSSHLPPTFLDSPYASPYATLHRKRPSVSYVHSGLKESRERVVQRGLKWLVVVVPPVSFAREHGHLGHTLSSGPSRRLSSGILMPLFPSLNSQLGAIAREFSFPSISGLCVYLHTTHSGVSLVPRVSDDTWPLLWSHLFDARSPSLPPAQLPISGQIEFDIDLTKARWYDSWLASSRRDYVDVPQSVAPSRPQSISHWRADSQGSLNEVLDDQTDVLSLAQQPMGRGAARNIKKLSLLDRFDTVSIRSGSKLVPRDESPPSQTARQSLTMQALSPIVQEDEPGTAKNIIDSRVQSWRMSATAAARSPLAATGQTSLDPVNMPNIMQDLPTASASEFELNLDDYTWSVSSAGPPDYDMESVYSWDRVPSVHLDRRGEGSVCLTVSDATSFGPDDDYVPLSPEAYSARLPSPDIAWRMFDDVPPTPTTATSWGAPLSWPPSPAARSYAGSIDIAARHMSSRPVTPTTATSWGAPLSFPPSPVEWSRAPSPDIAWRAADSVPSSPKFRRAAPVGELGEPSHLVFPYDNPARASSWLHVWPYTERKLSERMSSFTFPGSQQLTAREAATHGYPVLDIYPAVYPAFDIYPALMTLDDRKLVAPVVRRGADYPIFDIYPAIYPNMNVYPAALTIAQNTSKAIVTKLSSSYPNMEIYPAVYPHFNIYPPVSKVSRRVVVSNTVVEKKSVSVVSVLLPSAYPVIEIYPAVYPHSLESIYPAVQAESVSKASSGIEVRLQASYPVLEIYPAVYPYNLERIYPSVVAKFTLAQSSVISVGVKLQYPVFDIYPSASGTRSPAARREVVVSSGAAYPFFNIYPAVYPWSVYEIYPPVSARGQQNTERRGVVVTLESQYPVFNIYPAIYPYNMEFIYPAVAFTTPKKSSVAKPSASAVSKVASGHIRKPSWKRGLPPVPPLPKNVHALTPFSAASGRPLPVARVIPAVSVTISAAYPVICLYPPVYPHFDIYPAVASQELSTVNVELRGKVPAVSQYPHLVIYPLVYPFIEVYPGSWELAVPVSRKPKYTHMELRAQVHAAAKTVAPVPVPARRRPKYTHIDLYAQVLAATRKAAPVAIPPPVPSPIRSPSARVIPPAPAAVPARPPPPVPTVRGPSPAPAAPPAPPRRPAQMDLQDDVSHINVPTIVAVEPSPTGTDDDPFSPVLFEMVTAPSPSRVSAPPLSRASPAPPPPGPPPSVAPPATPPTQGLTRSRSGTVTRPPVPPVPSVSPRSSPPPRSTGPRPLSTVQPPSSELPPIPSQRATNRLSGLPAHPAVNRRISSSIPRPMSTFGPLPSVPAQDAPAPTPSPSLRRQTSMMSPLAEEAPSPIGGRSPFSSPPEDWQRSFRTPTEGAPISPLSAGLRSADLSRSKTMPLRSMGPRGPRSSTISDRARAFDNPNVVPNEDGPLKLSMLSDFPTPPRPPMPGASPTASPNGTRPVSKLDKSRYQFA